VENGRCIREIGSVQSVKVTLRNFLSSLIRQGLTNYSAASATVKEGSLSAADETDFRADKKQKSRSCGGIFVFV